MWKTRFGSWRRRCARREDFRVWNWSPKRGQGVVRAADENTLAYASGFDPFVACGGYAVALAGPPRSTSNHRSGINPRVTIAICDAAKVNSHIAVLLSEAP